MLNILIVDDSKADRIVLEGVTQQFLPNSNIQTADRLGAAIKLIDEQNFDIIISDVCFMYMNGLSDGYELIEYAKKKQPNIIGVLVTGSFNGVSTHRTNTCGAIGLAIKQNLDGYKCILNTIKTGLKQ